MITRIKKIIKKTILYDILKLKRKEIEIFFDKKRRISRYYKYTIVSAVYNVDKYLEEYFDSIANQTLTFEEHIYLVMVDDGSTDGSAAIIKKWQKLYPKNIFYIYKENGGQSSARNLGMEYVKTEWVTFIDPDDFLDYRYFEEIDSFLERSREKNIGLVSCNYIFYFEDKKEIKDSHPLKHRFKKNEKIVNPSNMEGHIQLSVNSIFFKTNLLKKSHIKFYENIRPNFEDGHFVNRYFIENSQIDIAFLKKAKYYYRKRLDESSTLDTSWDSVEKYIDVLDHGYLNLLKTSQKKSGVIPLYIQRTVLYELMYYFRRTKNYPETLNFLTSEEKQKYILLLEEIFKYIDIETILYFNLAKCRFFYKVGFLSLYKKMNPPYQIVYIDEYNAQNSTLTLRYYCHEVYYPTLKIDNCTTHPEKEKEHITYIEHKFLDEIFVREISIFLSIPQDSTVLLVNFDNIKTKLSFNGKQYKDGFYFNTKSIL